MISDSKLMFSKRVFSGLDEELSPGWLLVEDGWITATGKGEPTLETRSRAAVQLDLEDALLMPGLIDVHTFFTGWALSQIGIDLTGVKSTETLVQQLQTEAQLLPDGRCLIGLNYLLTSEQDTMDDLQKSFPERPVVLFGPDMETLIATKAATERYKLDPAHCYPEGYWRLLADALTWGEVIRPALTKYQELMHSAGVTSVKEMTFDDSYGLAQILKSCDEEDQLTLRFALASQPVGRPQDPGFADWCRRELTSDHLSWWGYNQMTDGSISVGEADLLEEYRPGAERPENLSIPNYAELQQSVLAADHAGDGYSLHAQGDAAVRQSVNIFEKCSRNTDGTLTNRCAITDLEMTDAADLVRMAQLGVVAEVYPQVPSLRTPEEAIDLANRQVGDKSERYWDRAGMVAAGVTVACATDFPLLTPSLPQSALYACVLPRRFDQGPYTKTNAFTAHQLMRAWTIGGAIDLGQQNSLGALLPGRRADIAVFALGDSEDLADQLAKARPLMTFVAGTQVWHADN